MFNKYQERRLETNIKIWDIGREKVVVIERGFEEQSLKEWFLPMKRLSGGKEQKKEMKWRRNNRNES